VIAGSLCLSSGRRSGCGHRNIIERKSPNRQLPKMIRHVMSQSSIVLFTVANNHVPCVEVPLPRQCDLKDVDGSLHEERFAAMHLRSQAGYKPAVHVCIYAGCGTALLCLRLINSARNAATMPVAPASTNAIR
jgi:hypothetical protein